MIAPVTHILPLTLVSRSRMLPSKGRVTARVGQNVNALDVVAEADLPGSHILIDVRRILGLRRIDQAHRLIERKPGERVEKGDILAQTGGILSKVIRAPETSHIVSIQKGQILLEKSGEKFELKAGLTGTITKILPERGVFIETNGSLIQGLWGNGQINQGMLHFLAKDPLGELNRANLDVTLRGSVVVAGHVNKADPLQACDELLLRGLILGSMSADLLKIARKVTFPVVVIDGFGEIPLNQLVFDLLKAHDKRDVSLNAGWDPIRGDRPEVVIPLPAFGQPPQETSIFINGKTVRVLTMPYAGRIGKIVAIRPGLTKLSNGLRVSAAEILLENSQVVTIPLANLDVLE